MGRNLFMIDGKMYMSTKAAGDLWGLSPGTVARYCKSKKIKAFKDTSGRWCIPIDTFKPLSDNEISQLLILTLQLKNDPELKIDYSVLPIERSDLRKVYDYLAELEFIEKFDIENDEDIPYKAVLTQKGFKMATVLPKKENTDYSYCLSNWAKIICNLSECLKKVVELSKLA